MNNSERTWVQRLVAPQAILALIAGTALASSALAAPLPSGTILTIKPGTGYTPGTGSYFIMGGNPGAELAPGTGAGLVLGGTTVNGEGNPTSTAIVAGWTFAGLPGYNRIDTKIGDINSTAPSDNGDGTFNMGAWTVNWNAGDIDMSAGSPATFTCTGGAGNCTNGGSYTLDYTATVPSGPFIGVTYQLHLEGNVYLPGAPVAKDDTATTTIGNAVTIDVLKNDVSSAGLDPSTVTVTTNPTHGTTSVNTTTGAITYTPNASYQGTDSFQYTVKDTKGVVTASPATVTVSVQKNVAPVANNDTASVITGTSTVIDVLANDSDANNNLDPTTVAITAPAAHGTTSINPANGQITYTPNAGFSGTDTFAYTVADTGGLTSAPATVTITVQAVVGDMPQPTSSEIPVLFFSPGALKNSADSSAGATGSYFTMQVQKTTTIYVPLKPGPSGGVVIGENQPASGSHSGAPDGTESPGIDQPWNFFGNTGMHYTKNGGVTVNSDGTLDFSNRWFVTWNGIPAINMGGCTGSTCPGGVTTDTGKASISCGGTCTDGSNFTLLYSAHVPLGDPSGFGGVPYGLHLVGTVGLMSSTLQSTAGTTVAAGATATANGLSERMTADQLTNVAGVPVDSGTQQECVGGCFDFKVTGLTGSSAQVVLPLSAGVPNGAGYRKYMNGQWQNFDTSGGDSVKSAPYTPGSGSCPAPGSSAYRTLTPGDFCLELTIADNGPNDSDSASGTVADPGGLAVVTAAPTYVDTRTSGSSGCSINPNPVAPGNGGAWLIVGGFIAWLGVAKRIRRRRTDRSAR